MKRLLRRYVSLCPLCRRQLAALTIAGLGQAQTEHLQRCAKRGLDQVATLERTRLAENQLELDLFSADAGGGVNRK